MRLKVSNKTKLSLEADEPDPISHVTQTFSWRFMGVYILLTAIFIFLFVTLFQLQILEGGDNLLIASRTHQSTSRVLPPRGLIFDVAGNKLAINVPAYIMYVNPNEISSKQEQVVMTQVAALIGVDKDELWQTYQSKVYKDNVRSTASRVTLKSDLSYDQHLNLLAASDELPGVYIQTEPVRQYVNGSYFADVIGYTGDPSQSDLKNGISSESQVGKTGLEQSYDSYLRGTEGIEITEKGVFDDRNRTYTPQEAQDGDNLFLTIDSDWQKKLTDLMQQQLDTDKAFAATAVIMNSKTGEIKAMVTLPSYDNNLFAKGISGKDFSSLINNPRTPLINRAIGLQLPPGSTFKLIGATAGLEEGVITADTKFLSNRCMTLPGNIKFCEADQGYIGEVNVEQALAKSSNIFFCNVALQLNAKKNGIRTQISYGNLYGIGQLTGVDLPGEQKGNMPSPELKQKLLKEPWYTGDECNTIIGQGLVTVTPMQMTVMTAAVENGGKVMKPYLVSRIEDQVGTTVFQNQPTVVRDIGVSQKTLSIIKTGMAMTARAGGTASALQGAPGNPIAKTGSSDAGEYIQGKYYSGAHSWVIGCFDYKSDNYCFTIMQQFGGRGYKTVPIMKKFIDCVYNDFADHCG